MPNFTTAGRCFSSFSHFEPLHPTSSSVRPHLSHLGVRECRWRRVPALASPSGHGGSRRGVVRGRVPHLPLGHCHQPHAVLLVWRGRHLQPFTDQPEADEGHSQQPTDQGHLSHPGRNITIMTLMMKMLLFKHLYGTQRS